MWAGRQTGRVPGSLRDVLPAAAALLGVADAGHEPGGSAVTDWVGAERVDRVLVLLVDGLGWQLLAQLAGDAPLLAAVRAGEVGRLTRLDCTFPSTTPTSLVSLATGAAPGQHGILGFTLLNHVRWRDDPARDAWQPLPTCARAVLPSSFLGSGLTEAAYRGARLVPAPRLVGEELRAGPGLVYGYTAELDTAAHLFGIGSPQWHTAAAAVDALLSGLLEALPPNAALLVTADHGGLNVPPEARVDLDCDPRLAAGIRVAAVYSRVQAVATGMFGPVADRHLPRLGDVVVVCSGDTAVLASAHEPPETARLVGFTARPRRPRRRSR